MANTLKLQSSNTSWRKMFWDPKDEIMQNACSNDVDLTGMSPEQIHVMKELDRRLSQLWDKVQHENVVNNIGEKMCDPMDKLRPFEIMGELNLISSIETNRIGEYLQSHFIDVNNNYVMHAYMACVPFKVKNFDIFNYITIKVSAQHVDTFLSIEANDEDYALFNKFINEYVNALNNVEYLFNVKYDEAERVITFSTTIEINNLRANPCLNTK